MMTMQRIHTTPRASRGFTLVELMIVVAVIAILGAIAYPSYQEYARKGRRGEARAALLELRQQQERYMTQFNTYKTFSATDSVPFLKQAGSNPDRPSYKLSAVACKTTEGKNGTGTGTDVSLQSCIKLIATPEIADPKVGNLSITTLGAKGCTGEVNSTNSAGHEHNCFMRAPAQ